MFPFKSLVALVALAASVSAHTIFTELHVNGVSQGHLQGIRYPNYDGPVEDVTSVSMVCNGAPNPLQKPYSTVVIPVVAGDTLTAEWHHTLVGLDPSDPEDPIAKGHWGPIMVYLAKVDSALAEHSPSLKWFKIYEDGLDSNGVWAVEKLIANKGKHSFTLPKCIANGDYLLRAELIALHAAGSYPGAQFYMECAQIRVSGGTGTLTPATVSFPGAYAGTDPGVKINIYYPPVTNYIIPGPRPITCGTTPPVSSSSSVRPSSTSTSSTRPSSSSSSTSSTRPPSSSSSSTSTRPSSTSSSSSRPSSSASSTSSSASGGAPLYGQCGGIGWTGPTTCAAGTCKKSNDYYSQCLN